MITESAESKNRRKHTATALITFNVIMLSGCYFLFSWEALIASYVVWNITNKCVGIGFHRLLTHRSFKTWKWLEYSISFIACNALQGGNIVWVQMHRMHHENTDEPKDPHSPREKGFWWAQIGWMVQVNPNIERDVLAKYAPDLEKDSFHRWLNRYWWTPTIGLAIILFAVGWFFSGLFFAFALVFWVSIVGTAVGWQITWLVNSGTHIRKWGYRNFDDLPDDSCNNPIIAWPTFGEGWHNNHHKYPSSARHGLRWWEIDTNYITIWVMKKLGLVWDIKLPPPRTQ